jgi:1-hydroxycarotenoid 3,4-desaturase
MSKKIVVIGAGVGGLAAAIRLASLGHDVTVLEKQNGAGGKMMPAAVDGVTFDTGPTVLTMLWAIEDLFNAAGTSLNAHLILEQIPILARHFWSQGKQLDLFSDAKATEDAISAFSNGAANYKAFAQDSQRLYDALRDPFLRKQRPSLFGLATSMPFKQFLSLNPIETFWQALQRYFKDPRLLQLFGRYATYCGSSPFKTPATLMLIAAVEAQGVWRVKGGMAALAKALEQVARNCGVVFHFNCAAKTIETQNDTIKAVTDDLGLRHACEHVVVNADSEALAAGFFGVEARKAAQPIQKHLKSLSAITWCLRAKSSGHELQHHNVFFSDDYIREFAELETDTAKDPTVYLCDQGDDRKLLLVNAPANGRRMGEDVDQAMLQRLNRCGLEIDWTSTAILKRDPSVFSELYPATGGALYGRSSHGWTSTFQRPQARTSIPGLYLAGGYTHPGPGVPMAILSGQLAAEALMQDLASTRRFHTTAIAGGTSTR